MKNNTRQFLNDKYLTDNNTCNGFFNRFIQKLLTDISFGQTFVQPYIRSPLTLISHYIFIFNASYKYHYL